MTPSVAGREAGGCEEGRACTEEEVELHHLGGWRTTRRCCHRVRDQGVPALPQRRRACGEGLAAGFTALQQQLHLRSAARQRARTP